MVYHLSTRICGMQFADQQGYFTHDSLVRGTKRGSDLSSKTFQFFTFTFFLFFTCFPRQQKHFHNVSNAVRDLKPLKKCSLRHSLNRQAVNLPPEEQHRSCAASYTATDAWAAEFYEERGLWRLCCREKKGTALPECLGVGQ
ncbi:hypothetical protein CEXT_710811 [Caerostris extrusa]|uniref:Uncharacterized protein n=1 Tax=Caerostris extrusa TaxID=172846 RepID=A0AAV4TNV4_CAEEX|nr:hypothetical protein CEXT_710811 [Caerostris extrusa]